MTNKIFSGAKSGTNQQFYKIGDCFVGPDDELFILSTAYGGSVYMLCLNDGDPWCESARVHEYTRISSSELDAITDGDAHRFVKIQELTISYKV